MDLVLLGAPGAGKGTQGAILAERLGVPKIATGDILRDAVRKGTPLGREAQGYMDAGDLVPDTIILGLVREVLESDGARGGAILDGFPRTVLQAELVDRTLAELDRQPDGVLLIEVDQDTIVRRMGGRRSCPDCGNVFNVLSNPPAVAGRCDVCGGTLVQRPDDAEDKVRHRLQEYAAKTAPLIEYYSGSSVPVHRIDGDRPIEAVQTDILGRLGL